MRPSLNVVERPVYLSRKVIKLMYNKVMIAHIFGMVTEKSNNSLIVDVQGVGYEIQVAASEFEKALLNEKIKLYTYHHIREQSQELFGFSSLTGKKMFELLVSVQGVGPKAALSILGLGSSDMISGAIAARDTAFIARASGIGKRTAERVVVDLADKVGLASVSSYKGQTVSAGSHDDALEALVSLGYNLSDATQALENVPSDLSDSERIKLALKKSR